MKLNLEITSIEDAKTAISLLTAYCGGVVTAEVIVNKGVESDGSGNLVGKSKEEAEEKEEKAPAKKRTTKAKAPTFTKESVTELAKAAVAESDRVAVKAIIAKYGTKISEVDEADYEALSADLQAIIDEAV